MLEQLEGSQAVAEAVALCRPEVISAYPISPQTHIVEGLSDLVRTGRARAVRVHDGRVGVRRDVGVHRRLRGRRAHLHGDREPGAALHGRGALQRLGPRAADRDDGRQPGDRRADQHLERPLATRCRSATRAGSSSTPRPTRRRSTCTCRRSGSPRRLSLPVMVCMDGFILTHAYEQVDVPDPGAGRRLPAAVRAAPGARPGRAGDDRRDGRAGGVHRGQVPDARQADAGARRDPRDRRASSPRPSAAPPAASCAATGPRTRRRSSSRSARCWGRSRTSIDEMREEGMQIGALAIKCFRPYPLDEVRAALARRGAGRRLEKAFAVGVGGIVGQNVRLALSGARARAATRDRRPRRAADHEAIAAALFADAARRQAGAR